MQMTVALFLALTGLVQVEVTISINHGCSIQCDSNRNCMLRGMEVSIVITQGMWPETRLPKGLTMVLA